MLHSRWCGHTILGGHDVYCACVDCPDWLLPTVCRHCETFNLTGHPPQEGGAADPANDEEALHRSKVLDQTCYHQSINQSINHRSAVHVLQEGGAGDPANDEEARQKRIRALQKKARQIAQLKEKIAAEGGYGARVHSRSTLVTDPVQACVCPAYITGT